MGAISERLSIEAQVLVSRAGCTSAITSGDPRDHDGDPADHDGDPGDHEALIRAITMR
jgi:hypothetical protein